MSMYPRAEYEMTTEELNTILDACKPVRCMMIGGTTPSSPQENANRAWAALGKKRGFDSTTVQPIRGKGTTFFTAVPSETEEQRAEREVKEASTKRAQAMTELRQKIASSEV